MDPLVGAAALGVAVDLLGLSSQQSANETNLQFARETNEQNYKMFKEQMAYQTDMWNRTNAYNTAKSQRQRLEAAGLNPYLMMQGGNAGTAEMQTAPQPNPAQRAEVRPLNFAGLSEHVMQLPMMLKQQEGMELDNDSKRIALKTQLQEQLARISKMRSEGRLSRFHASLLAMQERSLLKEYQWIDEKNESYLQYQRAQTRQETARAIEQEFRNSNILPLVESQMKKELRLTDAQINAAYAAASHSLASAFAARMQGRLFNEQAITAGVMRWPTYDLTVDERNKLAEDITKSSQWRELNLPQDKSLRYANQVLNIILKTISTATGSAHDVAPYVP